MTYEHDGVQDLVAAVSSGGCPGELLAFRVPEG